MNETINRISVLLEQMREHALRAQIADTDFDLPILDMYPEDVQTWIKDELEKLLPIWQEIHSVWTLPHISPEMWKNYELLCQPNSLPEQRLLAAAQGKFRRAFKAYRRGLNEKLNKTRRQNSRQS